ncbi:MAG: Membrane-associated zinc metalloprotease [Candidatus Gottesmanbacteria bacterium GW2011_GWA2_44_17]|uniref:Membrane-associated zinc metalloprotease n=2 Tax=Candidatus Gottesmaniibacteriota TaxID=1752720 RepID=A0A0G1KGB1_9BACT
MLLTAITFLLILSILVFVHEFGHYISARIIGVKVEEFGFGLPPRIFGKKIKGTIYSINWLPIGGFVKLAGEDEEDETHTKDEMKHKSHYFWARSKKERAAILLSGVFMNFFLAVLITSVLLVRGVVEPTKIVRVEKVSVGSPAEAVGIREKDIVKSVTVMERLGKREQVIENPDILISTVKAHAGEMILVTLLRDGKQLGMTVIPRKDPPAGEGALGIAISNLEKKVYPWYQAPFRAVVINGQRMWQMLSSLGNLLFRLVTGQDIQSGEVAGPVGIAQVTGQAVKYGIDAVLEFASILSLNLALLNILPFPALDGGRLAFVVFEKLGKKARPQIERTIHQIGMMLLLGLLVFITVNDVLRLVRG